MTSTHTDEVDLVAVVPGKPWVLRAAAPTPDVTITEPIGVLGRARGATYRVPHPTVSRHHAQLEYVDDILVLSDLGSASGTWVDGQRLTAPVALTHAVDLRVGDVRWTVAAAGAPLPIPERATTAPQPAVDNPLTPRQEQVLRGMAEGLTNAEIAERLGLAPRTVKAYAAEIFDRLGRRTRAGAVAVGLRLGILENS